MIAIKKTIFETPKTIPEMVETIVMNGMRNESHINEHMKLSTKQVDWINEFVYPSNHIVHLKGERNSGRTSFGIGMILTTALFKEKSTSLVMSSTQIQDLERKTLDYLRIFCEIYNLPEIIQNRTRSQITLANGSKILFSRPDNINSIRGLKLDNLFLDLFNIKTMENLDEEFMSYIIPSLYSGKLIITLER